MKTSSFVYLLALVAFVGFFVWLGNRPKSPPMPVTPTTALTPPPSTVPSAAPVAPVTPMGLDKGQALDSPKIRNLAERARVEVLKFERRGPTGMLEVQWSSNRATQGAEFCDLLRTEGIIRMYDSGAVPLRMIRTPDGLQAYVAQFKITF